MQYIYFLFLSSTRRYGRGGTLFKIYFFLISFVTLRGKNLAIYFFSYFRRIDPSSLFCRKALGPARPKHERYFVFAWDKKE